MKVRSYVCFMALGLLAACGTSGNPQPAGTVVDQNTPAITTGAKCAAASLKEFTPPGKRIGVSQIPPGTYTYSDSKHLYVGENKADSVVIEGYATDRPADVSFKKFVLNVDCQSATGLKPNKTYDDRLDADFPISLTINQSGDMSLPGHRFVTELESQGQFAVIDKMVATPKTTSNAELKGFDAKNVTTPNKKLEWWQDVNGDLYLVRHSGVNWKSRTMGVATVTRDSIIRYVRTDSGSVPAPIPSPSPAPNPTSN